MKWKQFLTPVSSITWEEADELVADQGEENIIFLDVRQPGEYEARHIPGAMLAPLGNLDHYYDELDKEKHLVVY